MNPNFRFDFPDDRKQIMMEVSMSRYRSLYTEADNSYISPFAVGHILEQAERDKCLEASPENPNPSPIPSYFDDKSWQAPVRCMRRCEPVISQPPERIIDRSTVYGPSSAGHASLRYYGVGPY
jgi:hypothetical protein